jgi:hypothetical protein
MHAPQPQPSVLSESQSPEDNDMSLDFIVEDPLVFKRKRSSKACELCRLRKVRCDGMLQVSAGIQGMLVRHYEKTRAKIQQSQEHFVI